MTVHPMFDVIPKAIQTSHEQMMAFSNFIGTLLGNVRLRHRALQPVISHYTNATGFCGILDSAAIHATHIAFMNDADEYKHAIDLFLSALTDAKRRIGPSAQARIVEAMERNLKATSPSNYYPVFISCFSVLHDDLSQWRAYGGQNAGFSIGFGVNHLSHLTDHWRESGEYMGYVAAAVYEEVEKIAIISEVIDFVLERYPADEAKQQNTVDDYAERWMSDFFSLIASLAPLLKHDSFKAEQEWRLILTPMSSKGVQFKPKQGLVCPYLKIDLSGHRYEEFDYPLRQVMIGPTRYTELNHRAAWSMLSLRGHIGVDVQNSKIPYRDIS